jgi:hypothetical protein
MSTGEGIFLAGLAIAFALLLWNPDTRRLVAKSLKWIIGISIILGLVIWAYKSYRDYEYRKVEAPIVDIPSDNPQLFGVKLGDKRNDVIYKKGKPKKSVGVDDEYENAYIYYDDNRVSSVFYSCALEYRTELTGIACSDSAEKVKKRFEGKIKEYCLPDTPTDRIFMIAEFNTIYVLQQETVRALGIKSGSSKKWVECHAVN